MARLIGIEAEDFAGFARFKMPLAKQGLVFIVGDNRDSEAATSNGACKSGLFKALGWGLYGEAIDGEPGDRVIRRGSKCARVVIEIEDRRDVYRVVRERRKQSPKLFFEKNGAPVLVSKADLQRAIDALVGVDWEAFRNTVLYGQRDRDRFVYPTTKDSVRKSILHRMLGTGVFELCHREAKKRRLSVEKERDGARADVERLTQRIGDHELASLRARRDGHADEVERRVRELTESARELAEKAKEAGASIDSQSLRDELEALDGKLAEGRASIERANDGRKKAREESRRVGQVKADLNAELRAQMAALAQLKGDRCPVCTGDLSEGHAASHRAGLLARGDQIAAKLKTAERAEQEAVRAEREAEWLVTECEENQRRMGERRAHVTAELEALDTAKARVRELVSRSSEKANEARVLRDAPNPHFAPYLRARKKVRALRAERKAARATVKVKTAELELLTFWARGFGPTGIPSFALDTVMPLLTDRANHYLMTLSGGDIKICFSTQRELKGGEMRDEIGITWEIEGIEGYPPSGGQWKKMEIATNFALMDLVRTREGSHVNILCLDECLDGLDGEGRQRVVELLHTLRKERESIFLISHDPDLAEAFERTLIVIKENGVSRLERAA
jgi:DNA repair exonuclease SbcCD ATPase subunit